LTSAAVGCSPPTMSITRSRLLPGAAPRLANSRFYSCVLSPNPIRLFLGGPLANRGQDPMPPPPPPPPPLLGWLLVVLGGTDMNPLSGAQAERHGNRARTDAATKHNRFIGRLLYARSTGHRRRAGGPVKLATPEIVILDRVAMRQFAPEPWHSPVLTSPTGASLRSSGSAASTAVACDGLQSRSASLAWIA
jgi:hypothetical protein